MIHCGNPEQRAAEGEKKNDRSIEVFSIGLVFQLTDGCPWKKYIYLLYI